MKYCSQYRSHDLFELQESLSGLSKPNRWVKLVDSTERPQVCRPHRQHLPAASPSHCQGQGEGHG